MFEVPASELLEADKRPVPPPPPASSEGSGGLASTFQRVRSAVQAGLGEEVVPPDPVREEEVAERPTVHEGADFNPSKEYTVVVKA